MINIGVIGTAGRARVPTVEEWEAMLSKARWVISLHRLMSPDEPITLVSGGAAWSDHIAVRLFLEDCVDGLVLHLPGNTEDARVAEYYSGKFFDVTGISRLKDIKEAKLMRGYYENISGNFKERNLRVAQSSTNLLVAFTYGPGDVPADGGTSHTWRTHMHLYPEVSRVHFSIQNLESGVTKKGGDKQMTLFNKFVQDNIALAETMLGRKEKAASNPTCTCNNCVHGSHTLNEWDTFDKCLDRLGLGTQLYTTSTFDNIDENEKGAPYNGNGELANWLDEQEIDYLHYSHRDDTEFDRTATKSELKAVLSQEVFTSRAMYLYGPTRIGDDVSEEDFTWYINPDRCIRHQYNWAAMSRKETTEETAALHIRDDVVYVDGSQFHTKMKPGVVYWRDVFGIPVTKDVKFPGEDAKKVYFPMWLFHDPLTGYFTWKRIVDWDRYDQILEYWERTTHNEVLAWQVRQIALAQFKHELGQKVWDIYSHSRIGGTIRLALAALPDTKVWLEERGIPIPKKPDDVFATYRRAKKVEDLCARGCPELGEAPPGDYVAVLDGLNAVTGKGTIITEEVQATYTKMYWVRNIEAYKFNTLSVEERMKFIGCQCNVPCADVVVDLEKLLTEEYSDVYGDFGCDRPKEMADHEERLLPGYTGRSVEDDAVLRLLCQKFGLGKPRKDVVRCNICHSPLAPDNKGTICTSHVKRIEKRMEANRKN